MRRIICIASFIITSLISIQAFAGSLPIPLKQGMPYDKARSALIDAGWQTEPRTVRRMPDMSSAEASSCGISAEFSDKMCRQFEEWDGCGHVCDMFFIDATNGKRLRVMTDHNDNFDKPKLTGFIKGWEFEDKM
jgi:hypothetical protein